MRVPRQGGQHGTQRTIGWFFTSTAAMCVHCMKSSLCILLSAMVVQRGAVDDESAR